MTQNRPVTLFLQTVPPSRSKEVGLRITEKGSPGEGSVEGQGKGREAAPCLACSSLLSLPRGLVASRDSTVAQCVRQKCGSTPSARIQHKRAGEGYHAITHTRKSGVSNTSESIIAEQSAMRIISVQNYGSQRLLRKLYGVCIRSSDGIGYTTFWKEYP